MKWFRRILLVVLAVAVVGVGTAWAMVRSDTPAIPLQGEVGHEEALEIRRVLEHVGDPRKLAPGTPLEVTLSQEQVDVLLAEASRRFDEASARVRLRDGAIDVEASAASPWPWITPYVDVVARITGTLDAPRVLSAKVGNLTLPPWFLQPRVDQLYGFMRQSKPWIRAAVSAVDRVDLREGEVTVAYRWSEELEKEIRKTGRALVLGELDASRILAYHEALTGLVSDWPPRERLPFVGFLRTLFDLADRRTESGGEPMLELRAASLVGTYYLIGRPLGGLVDQDVPRAPKRTVVLWNRSDLPKHFLVSVVLTMWGDRAFADALGLSKEITDSTDDGGSGFSFADLAADRAGTQLAERAMASDRAARALIARLAAPLTDAQLLPDPTRLPEGMSEERFREVYSHVNSPEYTAVVDAIDARLAASDVQGALP